MFSQDPLGATTAGRPHRHELLKRPSRSQFFAGVLLLLVVLVTLTPKTFAPYDLDAQVTRDRLKSPMTRGRSGQLYILGTDQLGRDILSRVIYGMRTSMTIGIMAVAIAAVVGCTVALIAGYRGGIADDVLMRLADIQQAFPFILLAIVVIGVLGPSISKVIIVLGVANWVTFARVIRSEVLALRSKEFVDAARCIGATERRIVGRHILPSVVPSITVVATFTLASIIVAEAGLSFLALGVPPSTPSWGGMLAEGREYIDTAWWLSTFPGAAIFVFVFVISLAGDRLRDALDPHVQQR